MNNYAVFKGSANSNLADEICEYLEVDVSRSIVSRFPDGETFVKIDEDIRGKDCFIIQSTCPPANDNLMELLITIDTLRRASANSITAVMPYFGYARQDRKTGGRTPITAKMVADLLTKVGTSRILTLDLHADQIEGFFNIPVDHLRAVPIFVKFFRRKDNLENTIILSPDVGNMKTAALYAEDLGTEIAVIDKRRISGEEAIAQTIVGDVDGKDVIMFDDMISTASTICGAAKLAKKRGAKSIKVAATHGLFSGSAHEKLIASSIDEVVVADTMPLSKRMKAFKEDWTLGCGWPKLVVLNTAPLLAEAIARIYYNRSVSILLQSDYESHM